MVVGIHGPNGAHALKRVALEHNTANATAINQDQHMAASTVLDRAERPRNALTIPALVKKSLNYE